MASCDDGVADARYNALASQQIMETCPGLPWRAPLPVPELARCRPYLDLSGGLPVMVMAVLMVRGFAAACSTSSSCSWSRRCWCRLPSRRCPVTPQCAFVSTAATVAGRGRLALLDGGKAAVGSIKRKNTPRIILSARSSRKPVAEHDHANGEERQSHCVLPTSKRREARPR